MSVSHHQLTSHSVLSRVRRNHGLEHATINILSQRFPKVHLIGRSDHRGFYIFGDVSTDAVRQAVDEALDRLYRGEQHLAIHPNCGTNLVITAFLAATGSFLTLLGSKGDDWRRRFERYPSAILVGLLALIISQPIGRAAQKYITTISNPGSLQVIDIQRSHHGRISVHRILTHI